MSTAVHRKRLLTASQKKLVGKIITYTAMTVVAIVMIFPFYYSLVTSFRNAIDIQYNSARLWPEQFNFANYKNLFDKLRVFSTPMGKVMSNTLTITFSILFGSLLSCSIAAYSLARLNWRGKKIVMSIFYASMMIPGVATLIPGYSVVQFLGMTNNKLGVIVPALASVYSTLFLRSFFLTTPREVAEAARIDGAGELKIFFTLYLRMIAPGLITLGLGTFNGNWNNYLWPKIILRNKSDYVLAIVIKEFQLVLPAMEKGTIMAASIVTILPTILIFVIGQKYFMDNLAFTGIK